jgi:hypothetical protein
MKALKRVLNFNFIIFALKKINLIATLAFVKQGRGFASSRSVTYESQASRRRYTPPQPDNIIVANVENQ